MSIVGNSIHHSISFRIENHWEDREKQV